MLKIELPESGRWTTWDSRWPETEGVYWFYGFPWGVEKTAALDKGPDLMCVNVRKIANGFLYVTEGFTISTYDGAFGFWSPVQLPEKPTQKNITDDGKTFRA